MSKIKVGSKVVRVGNSYGDVVKGGEYIVRDFSGTSNILLEGHHYFYDTDLFKVVEDIPFVKESPLAAFTIYQTELYTIVDVEGVAEIKSVGRLTLAQCEQIINIINN